MMLTCVRWCFRYVPVPDVERLLQSRVARLPDAVRARQARSPGARRVRGVSARSCSHAHAARGALALHGNAHLLPVHRQPQSAVSRRSQLPFGASRHRAPDEVVQLQQARRRLQTESARHDAAARSPRRMRVPEVVARRARDAPAVRVVRRPAPEDFRRRGRDVQCAGCVAAGG